MREGWHFAPREQASIPTGISPSPSLIRFAAQAHKGRGEAFL
jgi:hypothetical protein